MKKNEKSMGITFGNLAAMTVVGGLCGGLLGWGTMWLRGDGVRACLDEGYAGFLTAAPFFQIAAFLISGGLALFFYAKAARRMKGSTDEDEDVAGRFQNYSLMANAAGIAVMFLLFGLAMDERNMRPMLCVMLFLVTCLASVALEILVIYQAKKMNPMKKGDPGDLRFSKDWLRSCDEAEKLMIYRPDMRPLP